MLLGIMSDTHDELQRTRAAVQLLRDEGAEILIHCGDLASPEIVEVCSIIPFYFVFGNHDADMVPYLQNAAKEFGAVCLGWGGIVDLAGKRIGVTHGHMTIDVRHVKAQLPHYLLSGHSHEASDTWDRTLRRINPGALHRAEEYTVAVLNLESDELRFLRLMR